MSLDARYVVKPVRKALQLLEAAGQVRARVPRLHRVDDLQGDGALEAFVRGAVYGCHATTGHATADAVAPVDQRAQ